MAPKLGVFVCKCGENIASAIDVEALATAIGQVKDAAFVETHELLCAPDGREFVTSKIKEKGITHVVVAACSPKDHENTFQKCLEQAGINRYLLQMANIREHCAWVSKDKKDSLNKAEALVRAAIRRVKLHEELVQKEIEANPDVLVIGGGPAGIEAALTAAQAGRKVWLVEKSPSLGGTPSQFEEIAPNMECAPCMLAPRLDEVSRHENVTVMTSSEAEEMVGFLGNFKARIKKTARLINTDLCLGCDECIQACPVSLVSDYQHGLGTRKAVYVPFPGSIPNAAFIDRENCLRYKGESCTACADACPLEAVDYTQHDEVVEIDVGAVVVATGFSNFDPKEDKRWGISDKREVYTMGMFERLASNHGPTGGQVVMRNGKTPKTIAVVHCVGRKELGYCSGVCCQSALKTAYLLKGCSRDKGGDTEVIHLHTDLVLPGRLAENLKQKIVDKGARFVRTLGPEHMKVEQQGDTLIVTYKDAAGVSQSVNADMVVLSSGMTPSEGTKATAKLLDLVCDPSGFIAPDHPLIRPTEASLDGVFAAGCASGPKTVAQTVTEAKSAVGAALSKIQEGKKLAVEVITAHTVETLCSKCMVCVSVCPYRAPEYNKETDLVEVNEVLCKGCGTCVAGCASGAAVGRQFTDDQLKAEIREVLDACV
jgi:heterodisulfide reductase subunit A